MGAVISLTSEKPECDERVVLTLLYLLNEARAGRISGLAYVAMKPCGNYAGDLAGEALLHPVLALGLASALKDQIVNILR